MNRGTHFSATALQHIPLIQAGDDLLSILIQAFDDNQWIPQSHDVIVISSKIISKAEGRFVNIADVTPSEQAYHFAKETGKDPQIVEIILSESNKVSRCAPNVLITEHRLGFVSANSAVDQSNVGIEGTALLLPHDPDASAQLLRQGLQKKYNCDLAVIITDTHGRPFRLGNVGVAIGIDGVPALIDQCGEEDLFGRTLHATIQGYADMIASAAHLLCGEAAEGTPVICIHGLQYPPTSGKATDLNRDPAADLYR